MHVCLRVVGGGGGGGGGPEESVQRCVRDNSVCESTVGGVRVYGGVWLRVGIVERDVRENDDR